MESELESDKLGGIFPMEKKEKKKLCIVLSGGAARALAHIGVLQVLEENNIHADAVVGTSMGAAIGGIYAAGNLKKFTEEITKMSKSKLKSFLFSMRLRRINIDSVKSYGEFIKKYTGDKKIEKLPVSFTAIATDLKTGKEVYLNRGSLARAILASMSIPGIFKPVKYKNMLLVDGGVIDPLPFEYGRKIAKKVIVVNATQKKITGMKKKTHILNVLTDSAGIMSETIVNLAKVLTLQNLEDEKILFMQLDTNERKLFDFYDVQKLIEIGRKEAKKNLAQILELIKEESKKLIPIP